MTRPRTRDSTFKTIREAQLLHHPNNMRRAYPEAQVAEVAESIRARGVEMALIVVPAPKKGKYYVVDGNLRLEGARRLGKACPPLKCEIRDQAAAEQLLTMAVTNRFRYPVDPISEACHYRRLMDDEGYTIRSIAGAVGVGTNTVADLLLLLKLEPEIQGLIAAGKFTKDVRVARALLNLPPAARVKLARHMAGGKSVRAILSAAQRLQEDLAAAREVQREARQAGGAGAGQSPAICRVRLRKAHPHPDDPPALSSPGQMPADGRPMPWPQIREQARQACLACQVKADALARADEPAWALIAHAASGTCGDCSLANIASACDACPLVDLLRRLARRPRTETAHAAPP